MPPVTLEPPAPAVALDAIEARAEQAWNEAALAAPVRAPAVRFWHYRAPAVVLGRSQRGMLTAPSPPPAGSAVGTDAGTDAAECAECAECAALDVVDRQAGGGAVLVGPWMLGVSIVVPPDHAAVAGRPVAASYDWLGAAFVDALRALGVPARAAAGADVRKAPFGLEWACFAGVTAHEVLVDRRKIVGLAQRRGRHGALFVAGVLVDAVPWALLGAAMVRSRSHAGPRMPPARAGDLSVAAIVEGLRRETVSVSEVVPAPVSITAVAAGVAASLVAVIGADALATAATMSAGMLDDGPTDASVAMRRVLDE